MSGIKNSRQDDNWIINLAVGEVDAIKIAICDDREDDRGALKVILEAYGQDFEIREYGSGSSLCRDMEFIRECGINQ